MANQTRQNEDGGRNTQYPRFLSTGNRRHFEKQEIVLGFEALHGKSRTGSESLYTAKDLRMVSHRAGQHENCEIESSIQNHVSSCGF